jgi:hypothetical protein
MDADSCAADPQQSATGFCPRNIYFHVGSEVLTVVAVKNTVFWVVWTEPNVSEEFIAFIFRVQK